MKRIRAFLNLSKIRVEKKDVVISVSYYILMRLIVRPSSTDMIDVMIYKDGNIFLSLSFAELRIQAVITQPYPGCFNFSPEIEAFICG